jgi:carboxylesterase type B
MIGTNAGEYDQMFSNVDDAEILARITDENKEALKRFPRFIDNVLANYPKRSLKEACMDIKNDLNMRLAGLVMLDALSMHSDTYCYNFVWQNPALGGIRTPHGAEIEILFAHQQEQVPISMAKRMRLMWTNFARYGNPAIIFAPDWPQYKLPERYTMVINEKPEVVSGVRPKDIATMYPIVKQRCYKCY